MPLMDELARQIRKGINGPAHKLVWAMAVAITMTGPHGPPGPFTGPFGE
jgi:hypothetical protein